MRWILPVLLAAACHQPTAQAPTTPPPVQPVQPVRVDFEVVGTTDSPAARPERAQPPEIKLKLGHYRSDRAGIALVIDRTGDDAKLLFDGTDQVVRLVPQYFWHRTEYHRTVGHKMLETRSHGEIVLYLSGQEIWLYRDGDADPL
jgi:hypothetical protein